MNQIISYFGYDSIYTEERVAERWMTVWFIFPEYVYSHIPTFHIQETLKVFQQ